MSNTALENNFGKSFVEVVLGWRMQVIFLEKIFSKIFKPLNTREYGKYHPPKLTETRFDIHALHNGSYK